VPVTCFFSQRGGASGGDPVLVRESAEDLFSADRVLGEVDLQRPGVSLSGWELAEGTVRPGGVVMPQVLGQHPAQMVLIDDQHPVQELPAQGTDNPFADRVRSGRLPGLARILMPSAVNTASKQPVNWPPRSLIRNLTEAARWPRSIRKLRAACACAARKLDHVADLAV
jgi:hypothetical protein